MGESLPDREGKRKTQWSENQYGGQEVWSGVSEGRDIRDEVREPMGSGIMWGNGATIRLWLLL